MSVNMCSRLGKLDTAGTRAPFPFPVHGTRRSICDVKKGQQISKAVHVLSENKIQR